MRQVVEQEQRLELPNQRGMSRMNLCAALPMTGDDAGAREAAARTLPLVRTRQCGGVLFNHLALIAIRAGDAAAAARLLGHADRWYADKQSPARQASEAHLLNAALPLRVGALGEPECGRLRSEGSRLDEAQADALAMCVLRCADAAGTTS